MNIVVYLLLISGTWIAQDGIASVLYYCGKPGQTWRYDHLLRLVRVGFGGCIIAVGIYLGGI